MEKSFKIRFPAESEYDSLKKLWQTAFDDSTESLAFFFENTVACNRVLAVFDNKKPVSALYMLESEIVKDNKSFSAYYVYAVCTHPDYRGKGLMESLFEELFKVAKDRGIAYLFLVPEEKYLFDVYKKLGFEIGFTYSEKMVLKKDFETTDTIKTEKLTYADYRKCTEVSRKNVPFAILKESTFNSFFNSVSGEVKTAFVENEGYVLYEETEKNLIIYELVGNEKLLLSATFQNTEKEKIIYRQAANQNTIPYGMYYKLKAVPEIRNGFFGIPYAN